MWVYKKPKKRKKSLFVKDVFYVIILLDCSFIFILTKKKVFVFSSSFFKCSWNSIKTNIYSCGNWLWADIATLNKRSALRQSVTYLICFRCYWAVNICRYIQIERLFEPFVNFPNFCQLQMKIINRGLFIKCWLMHSLSQLIGLFCSNYMFKTSSRIKHKSRCSCCIIRCWSHIYIPMWGHLFCLLWILVCNQHYMWEKWRMERWSNQLHTYVYAW